MAVITNILFPVDFSDSCVAMAAYVKRAAAIWGANVSLIHVFDPASYNGFELYVRRPREVFVEHETIARDRLNLFLNEEFPVAKNPRILLEGDAAAQIARVAAGSFDLIVIPTHAGTFRQMLLGSTAAKVLDAADCPVVTSAHAQTIAPRPIEHREWLCAVDLSPDSERVLLFARKMVAQARGKLHLIHAIQSGDPDLPSQLHLEKETHHAEREVARRRIADLQQKVGLDAPVQIVVGSVKQALLDAARQHDADALMIGRSPHSGEQGRLRDLTYAVIRDSPFPVLSI
jgi:nucleotide-binding universal stress UspA family protein